MAGSRIHLHSDGLVLRAEMLIRIPVSSSLSPDFNYNTDGYEGDGAEDGKSQDGSETLPYIDESPTMSPQLCAPRGPDGETVSPTPTEGLLPGVRARSRTQRQAYESAAALHARASTHNFMI